MGRGQEEGKIRFRVQTRTVPALPPPLPPPPLPLAPLLRRIVDPPPRRSRDDPSGCRAPPLQQEGEREVAEMAGVPRHGAVHRAHRQGWNLNCRRRLRGRLSAFLRVGLTGGIGRRRLRQRQPRMGLRMVCRGMVRIRRERWRGRDLGGRRPPARWRTASLVVMVCILLGVVVVVAMAVAVVVAVQW